MAGKGGLFGVLRRFWGYTSRPQPPPGTTPAEDVIFGIAQPALGARVLAGDASLLRKALKPVAVLAVACAVFATFNGQFGMAWVKKFYELFAILAPLPSIVFARHYAAMAAEVRNKLGFGPAFPRKLPLHESAVRALCQAILVAIGLLPLYALLKLLPFVGVFFAQLLTAAWALQWVVADAFEDARTLAPGETLRMQDLDDERASPPWFVRFFRTTAAGLPRPFRGLLDAFANVLDRLAKTSRDEFALMEAHPWICTGFAVTTFALLATPVLNLFFRPIILVASAQLLGHLDAKEEPAPEPALAPAEELQRLLARLPR